MKRLLSLILLIVVCLCFSLASTSPALADGKGIFSANCAACHSGGGNVVNAAKTLKKEALEKYEMFSQEKIVYQVTNGKAAMPAFKGRLSADQIEEVAAYVLSQAEAGW
ncbi:MAG: c-type cytochrome [Crocosphaera sp.]|nr:c-type cytochrome [Crocosphaera sp.]